MVILRVIMSKKNNKDTPREKEDFKVIHLKWGYMWHLFEPIKILLGFYQANATNKSTHILL